MQFSPLYIYILFSLLSSLLNLWKPLHPPFIPFLFYFFVSKFSFQINFSWINIFFILPFSLSFLSCSHSLFPSLLLLHLFTNISSLLPLQYLVLFIIFPLNSHNHIESNNIVDSSLPGPIHLFLFLLSFPSSFPSLHLLSFMMHSFFLFLSLIYPFVSKFFLYIFVLFPSSSLFFSLKNFS